MERQKAGGEAVKARARREAREGIRGGWMRRAIEEKKAEEVRKEEEEKKRLAKEKLAEEEKMNALAMLAAPGNMRAGKARVTKLQTNMKAEKSKMVLKPLKIKTRKVLPHLKKFRAAQDAAAKLRWRECKEER